MWLQVKLNYQPAKSWTPWVRSVWRKKRHPKIFVCSSITGVCLGYINMAQYALEQDFELSKQKDTPQSGFKERVLFLSRIHF